ncbi:MAG: acyl-CoA dehydrogenase family protein [Burkholderiaceae bacterium]
MKLTEEMETFRDSVRRMAEKHVAPIAAEIDESDRFPTELVKLFGDMGLMQLWVPERYGGPEEISLRSASHARRSRVSRRRSAPLPG